MNKGCGSPEKPEAGSIMASKTPLSRCSGLEPKKPVKILTDEESGSDPVDDDPEYTIQGERGVPVKNTPEEEDPD